MCEYCPAMESVFSYCQEEENCFWPPELEEEEEEEAGGAWLWWWLWEESRWDVRVRRVDIDGTILTPPPLLLLLLEEEEEVAEAAATAARWRRYMSERMPRSTVVRVETAAVVEGDVVKPLAGMPLPAPPSVAPWALGRCRPSLSPACRGWRASWHMSCKKQRTAWSCSSNGGG